MQQRTGGPYNKIIKENGGPQIEFSNSHIARCPCLCVYVCMYHRARVCIRGLKIALTIYIFSLFNFQRIDVRYNVIIWITHVGSFNLYVVSRSYLFGTLFFVSQKRTRHVLVSRLSVFSKLFICIKWREMKSFHWHASENITEVFPPTGRFIFVKLI